MSAIHTASVLNRMTFLVDRGIYDTYDEMVQDAFRTLLRNRPELRVQMAIEMFSRQEASLSGAAEVAGMDLESFKETLREAGTPRTLTMHSGDLDTQIAAVEKARSSV